MIDKTFDVFTILWGEAKNKLNFQKNRENLN